MYIVVENRSHVGAVRVVTGGAVGPFDRVTDMLDFEGFLLRVVTLKTETRGLLLQKTRIICRSMWRMTGHAIIPDRSMRHLNLTDFLSQISMAVKTELTSRLDQIIAIIRRMRIMAGHTATLTSNVMCAHCINWEQIIVAAVTDLRGILGQQLAVICCVRIVTSGTLTFCQRRVDMLLFHRRFEVLVALETEFALCTGRKVVGVSREHIGANNAQSHSETDKYQQLRSRIHDSPLLSGQVTRLAGAAGERCMHHVFEILRVFRSMRVMTIYTIHYFGRDTCVHD